MFVEIGQTFPVPISGYGLSDRANFTKPCATRSIRVAHAAYNTDKSNSTPFDVNSDVNATGRARPSCRETCG